MKYFFTLFLLITSLYFAKAQRNIVLIITDDLGSDWCGFQENRVDTVNMPNVRRLLSNGVRFSNAWSNPLCSPTRAGILTGRYSFRTGVGDVITGATSAQLSTTELTIPQLLKNSNAPTQYATANIGKWHLQTGNVANLNNPSSMGFDHFAGFFSGQVQTSYTNWAKITNGVSSTSTTYSTVEQANDALTWLGQQTNAKPFFLWLAFNAPHFPFHLPPDSLITNHTLSGKAAHINANPKSYFKVMAEAMDNRIGKIYDWLEANNKLSNTDIIFVGDNGNDSRTSQTSISGRSKSTVYQAGVSVPLIISGPSVQNGGRTSTALVNVHDLFATIVEMGGFTNWQTQVSASKPVDSKSLMPILANTATSVRPWAFTEIFGTGTTADGKAIRNQDYKLINFNNGIQELYNLTNDPTEATNILSRSLTTTERTNYTYLCTEMGNLVGTSVCNSAIVPIELTTFTAKLYQKTTVLNWQTVSEKNNKGFSIERSSDGLTFNTIGEVKGYGSTLLKQDYAFTDNDPSVGTNYYRLRQTDFDGKESFSPIVSILLRAKSHNLRIKTTMVRESLDMVASDDIPLAIRIVNAQGQQTYSGKIQGTQRLDTSSWAAGLYIIQTVKGETLRFEKF